MLKPDFPPGRWQAVVWLSLAVVPAITVSSCCVNHTRVKSESRGCPQAMSIPTMVFIETQNHRITEVGKDPQDQQPNRPPTTSISHWATALSATSTPSSNTPRLVTPHSLGSPFQHPNTLLEKNFLLISNLPLLVHSHKATSISFSLFLLALFSPHNHKHVFWWLLTKQEYIPNRI